MLVNNVEVDEVLSRLKSGALWAGIDVGKSVSWPSKAISEVTARLKAQVQWLTAQQEIWQTWQG
ncbi:MAG: hypothetical protein ACKV2Q_12925 [Planctomycetaceae bacterium]